MLSWRCKLLNADQLPHKPETTVFL